MLFYASYSPQRKVRTSFQKLYLKNEGLFYKLVRKTPRVVFFKGYRSPASGKEKEVDVKLAVDMVNLAYRKEYDWLYLISGDADFHHALLIAQDLGKTINIIALENRLPVRFSYRFTTYVVLFCKTKTNYKVHSKQKIKFIELDDSYLIENIT